MTSRAPEIEQLPAEAATNDSRRLVADAAVSRADVGQAVGHPQHVGGHAQHERNQRQSEARQ